MADIQQYGFGGGCDCNLAFCIAILLVIQCCFRRSC